jgi:hypothetical protein
MKVIAIVGAAKAGKSTAADVLTSKGAVKVRFAQTLKDMLMTMGLTKDQVDGSSKEVPSDLLAGKTPRHAMQTLGTEWRNLISKDLWVRILEKKLKEMADSPNPPSLVLIDDCRFPHEVEMLRRIGGQLWAIRRPEVEPSSFRLFTSKNKFTKVLMGIFGQKPIHESEVHWWDFDADKILWNDGDEAEFKASVIVEAQRLLR